MTNGGVRAQLGAEKELMDYCPIHVKYRNKYCDNSTGARPSCSDSTLRGGLRKLLCTLGLGIKEALMCTGPRGFRV